MATEKCNYLLIFLYSPHKLSAQIATMREKELKTTKNNFSKINCDADFKQFAFETRFFPLYEGIKIETTWYLEN